MAHLPSAQNDIALDSDTSESRAMFVVIPCWQVFPFRCTLVVYMVTTV